MVASNANGIWTSNFLWQVRPYHAAHQKPAFMSCDTSIDDDALLSGLPSWNEKVKYTNRSAMPEQMEPALPDMTIESTTPQKTIPSITKITAEDDKRMAL